MKNLFKSKNKDKLTEDQLDAVDGFNTAMEDLEKANKDPEDTEEETSEEVTEETEADEDESEETEEETASEDESEEAEEEEAEKTEKSKTSKNKEVEKPLTKASPSLQSIIGEDVDAQAAMEIEPFLKSLVNALDKKLEAIRVDSAKQMGEMNEAFAKMASFQKAQSTVILAEGKLLKSLAGVDQDSLDEPLDRQSVLLQDKFIKSESGDEINYVEAKIKLTDFAKSGTLNSQQVGVIEGRINKNLPLPDYFIEMINKKQEDK